MTATRTDIHRPSFLDPAEYVEVGYVDNHPEQGGCWRNHEVIGDASEFPGNYTTRGRCDHCGAGPLRYAVEFLHVPSHQTVMVGERCAAILGLPSKSSRERRESVERARRELALAEFRSVERNETVYMWLVHQVEDLGNYGYGGFFHDVLRKCRRYGSLTEAQVAAVERAMVREDEFAARRAAESAALADAGPLVEGRREITGVVLSTKLQDSHFGETLKMLVREDCGNKVWGTVPASLDEWDADTGGYVELKGSRVTFTATVERSNDDEHFGFFKRPSGARRVES